MGHCRLPPSNIEQFDPADHAQLKDLGHVTQSLEFLKRVLQIEMASRVISLGRGRDEDCIGHCIRRAGN